jgi:hypothetical protein
MTRSSRPQPLRERRWSAGPAARCARPAGPTSARTCSRRRSGSSARTTSHRDSGASAAARVGPGFDLVADGSALRLHTVRNGVLLRTHEVLTFEHAADGATTLLHAAAAYERLAGAADAMAATGGRLVGSDAGLLEVRYSH